MGGGRSSGARSSGGHRSGGSSSSRSSSSRSTSSSSNRTTNTRNNSGGGFGGGFATGMGFGMGQQAGRNMMGGGRNGRGGNWGNNRGRGGRGMGAGRVGCGIEVFVIIAFIVIVLLFALPSNMSIQRSTVERTALTNVATGDIVTVLDATDNEDWFTNDRALQEGAREAHRLTGVKFGIFVTDNVANPRDSEMKETAQYLYDELFEDSNGHLLILLVDLGNGEYASWYEMGSAVQTVFDAQAMDILYGFLDKYWANPDRYTESEMFGLTLRETSERIMSVTPSTLQVMMPWLFGLLAIIVLFIGINAALKNNAKRREAAAEQARADAELLATPIAGLDGASASDPLLDKYSDKQE